MGCMSSKNWVAAEAAIRMGGPHFGYALRMLVAPIVRDILFYGGFAVGVVGLVCVAIGGQATKRRTKEPLPEAVLARKRPRNGVLWQLLGAFALIGGPAASIWLWFHSCQVVFVMGDGPTLSTHRQACIGGAYPAKRSLDTMPNRRATWIVNDSPLELTAQTLGYGDAYTSQPIAIPPGTSLPVASVDYIGPDDPPPGVITVVQTKEIVKAGIAASAKRVWLTWPRP
jgi:hypothetical protein